MNRILSHLAYLRVEDGMGRVVEEQDCLSCVHCCAVVTKAEYQVQGAFCIKCHGPMCLPCAHKKAANGGLCRPIEQVVDEQLARAAMWRAAGI